jgi:hypothetical protein
MQTQLKVVKTDGSIEEYLHTKVLGAISNALAGTGHADVYMAEQFAEVVTYYLYHQENRRSVTSMEILSVIKAVLTSTDYEEAAAALSEHHLQRKLKRSRIEVFSVDICELTDAEVFARNGQSSDNCRWDKSRIASDLVEKYNICRNTARTIASMVEEKVFNMGLTRVPGSLVRQLVLGDAAAVLHAEQQLQTV